MNWTRKNLETSRSKLKKNPKNWVWNILQLKKCLEEIYKCININVCETTSFLRNFFKNFWKSELWWKFRENGKTSEARGRQVVNWVPDDEEEPAWLRTEVVLGWVRIFSFHFDRRGMTFQSLLRLSRVITDPSKTIYSPYTRLIFLFVTYLQSW